MAIQIPSSFSRDRPLHRVLCKGALAGCAARQRGARGRARQPSPLSVPCHGGRPTAAQGGGRPPSSVVIRWGAAPFSRAVKGGNGPAATGALPLLYHAGRQIPMPSPKLPPFDKKSRPSYKKLERPCMTAEKPIYRSG
ncbi:hypothetical protein HMPREF0262_03058 [Clostridium sp. ATCC 29733]|nr:hypothetical protein HMPREF0262_03058 [Clostridium sp. ATCC 29733]